MPIRIQSVDSHFTLCNNPEDHGDYMVLTFNYEGDETRLETAVVNTISDCILS